MAELDIMEVEDETITKPNSHVSEFEVIKIVSRKGGPDGEHLYEVHWKDNDITFEPVSNLSGAADALRLFLEANYPDDPLLKMLSSLATESDNEENVAENGTVNNGVDKNLNFLARWHQKTTRGSSQYWLRKGEDRGDTPSLLKRDLVKNMESPKKKSPVKDTPLAPPSVPATPDHVSSVLFSDGEGVTPTSAKKVRKRIRIIEETVKMFPHEELGDLESRQNKTVALWQEMLYGILLVGTCACVFLYIYHHVYRASVISST